MIVEHADVLHPRKRRDCGRHEFFGLWGKNDAGSVPAKKKHPLTRDPSVYATLVFKIDPVFATISSHPSALKGFLKSIMQFWIASRSCVRLQALS
jgi:hypothetical protein